MKRAGNMASFTNDVTFRALARDVVHSLYFNFTG